MLESPLTQWSSHHIQVIELIAIGHAAGVVPIRRKDNIVIAETVRFVNFAVFGEDSLVPKTLTRVEAMVEHLFVARKLIRFRVLENQYRKVSM